MSNNIISFPGGKIGDPPAQNTDELAKEFLENKKEYIDSIVDHYATQLVNKLGMHGFEIGQDNFVNNFSYTIETFRATLYQTLDIEHPFLEHMANFIDLIDDEFEDLD